MNSSSQLLAAVRGSIGTWLRAVGEVIERRAEPGEQLVAAAPLLALLAVAAIGCACYAAATILYATLVLPIDAIRADWTIEVVVLHERPFVPIPLAIAPPLLLIAAIATAVAAIRSGFSVDYRRTTVGVVGVLGLAYLTTLKILMVVTGA
jgi:hypothetical protein